MALYFLVLVVQTAASNKMSILASFTFLKASDVPHLGFWSKPKPRLFRRPECKFPELLKQHTLREFLFDDSDGIYVAFVLAWMESQDERFGRYVNPVIGSLMKYIGGSHWVLQFKDRCLSDLIKEPLRECEWRAFLTKIEASREIDFEWASFETARRFVYARILELEPDEALLVSVG